MLGLALLSLGASVPATSNTVAKPDIIKRILFRGLWGLYKIPVSFPGIYDMSMEPLDFQSLISKYGIVMCQEHSVGVTDLTIFLVD